MSARRIMVVGATGFVGRALMHRIAARPGLAGFAGGRNEAVGRTLPGTFIATDLTQAASLADAMAEARPDVVINASSYGVQPAERTLAPAIAVNVNGAALVVEAAAAAGCSRVLHLGSCSEYGAAEGRIDEATPVAPVDLYGITKAAGSQLALERGRTHGLPVTVLRLFNVWGDQEPAHRLFPAVLNACLENRAMPLTDGRQLKDYSYVGDVADCLLDLADLDPAATPELLILASGKPISVREFALRVATRLGRPELLQFGAVANRPQEARQQIPDVTRLDALLPRRRLSAIEEVMDRMMAAARQPPESAVRG